MDKELNSTRGIHLQQGTKQETGEHHNPYHSKKCLCMAWTCV